MVTDTYRVLVGSVVYGTVVAVASGLIMLAFSSLSRNSRVVAILWLALWGTSGVIADVMVRASRDRMEEGARWWVVSFGSNLDRVREAALGTSEAYRKLVTTFQEAAMKAAEVAQGRMNGGPPRGPFGWLTGRRRPPLPELPNRPPPGNLEAPPMFASRMNPPFPWKWSVAVLSGLSLLSIVVLSNRIKSLDRLR